jgi:hypothetical protein
MDDDLEAAPAAAAEAAAAAETAAAAAAEAAEAVEEVVEEAAAEHVEAVADAARDIAVSEAQRFDNFCHEVSTWREEMTAQMADLAERTLAISSQLSTLQALPPEPEAIPPEPEVTRKRRADAGKSRGGTKAKGAPLDLNGLEGLLLAVHISLSAITGEEALQLQPEEAHAVAEAASNVSRHYDIRASQKVLDWGALGFVLAGIYGPRAAFIYQKSRAPKPPPPQRPAERPASNGKTAPDAFVVAAAQPWNG